MEVAIMLLGERISEVMKQENIERSALINKLNKKVSASYLSEIISGKYNDPAVSKVQEIAKALNTTVDNLLEGVSF
jgi:transcriptional regulator with XRE-family HTH domain